ncbi:ABC transporter permease [Mesorhizobium sp. INR15]|uniref:ABC transporter permease n=1 Tax=Mesorhizobium sp. INR15 TaxID=2654248 RepID=UPI001896A19A|nr:ABC transporter permease [Mesorhizobium sp. INR15]
MANQELDRLIQGRNLDDLIAEFRAKTTGQHSPELQRLINRIRSEPMTGKLALLCTRPHEEWRLVRMNGRGKPMTLLDSVFHNLDDAEWAIFKLRMKRHFDIDLND